MSVTGALAAFAIRHSFNQSADQLIGWLGERFTDHSRTLPIALERATERAWKVVSLALEGEGLFGRIKDLFRDRDLTALRDEIREFLANTPTGLETSTLEIRSLACEELNNLRKAGQLTHSQNYSELVADFSRYGNSSNILNNSELAISTVADSFADRAPNLAKVLKLTPAGGTPLLLSAFIFFFRREVETNEKLARGISFDSLRHLTKGQEQGFALLDGRTAGILDQFDVLFDALEQGFAETNRRVEEGFAGTNRKIDELIGVRDELRSMMSKFQETHNITTSVKDPLKLSVTSEQELSQIRKWRDALRKLPTAIVEGEDWLKIGDVLAGARMFAEAREAHEKAASYAKSIQDRATEAEAEYKSYRVACEEQGKWPEALKSLLRAAELDPTRFSPFPLHKYQPLAIIGVGGFGTVIRCREKLAKGREVAIKTFHQADVGREVDEVFAEANTLSSLSDPGIVKAINWDFADEAKSRAYIAMEYFPGTNLATLLKSCRPPLQEFIPLARQVAQAVQTAHKMNVLHRDLKPENILVQQYETGEWAIKVIDFGLAIHFSAIQASVSTSIPHRTQRDQSFAGTLEYASPEQKRLIQAEIGFRTDIYSFGKTMLEVLLGTHEPVTDDWEQIPRDYRDSLKRIFEKCVIRDPMKRHSSFEPIIELLTSLEQNKLLKNEQASNKWTEQAVNFAREKIADPLSALIEGDTGEMAQTENAEAKRQKQEKRERERAETIRMENWKLTPMARNWVIKNPDGGVQEDWENFVAELKLTPFWPLRLNHVWAHLETLLAEKHERELDEANHRERISERNRREKEVAKKSNEKSKSSKQATILNRQYEEVPKKSVRTKPKVERRSERISDIPKREKSFWKQKKNYPFIVGVTAFGLVAFICLMFFIVILSSRSKPIQKPEVAQNITPQNTTPKNTTPQNTTTPNKRDLSSQLKPSNSSPSNGSPTATPPVIRTPPVIGGPKLNPSSTQTNDKSERGIPGAKPKPDGPQQPSDLTTIKNESQKIIDKALVDIKSKTGSVRASGYKAIGSLGANAKALRRTLCEGMLDSDSSVQKAAVDALRNVDERLCNIAIVVMIDGPSAVRETDASPPELITALKAAGKLEAEAEPLTPIIMSLAVAISRTMPKYSNGGPPILLACVETLVRTDPSDPAVNKAVIAMLKHPDIYLRIVAVSSVSKLSNRSEALPGVLAIATNEVYSDAAPGSLQASAVVSNADLLRTRAIGVIPDLVGPTTSADARRKLESLRLDNNPKIRKSIDEALKRIP